MRKAPWNNLPAKPADKIKVMKVISNSPCKPSDLIEVTGLSKTRCLCAVDELIYENKIIQRKDMKLYKL
jgi:hypothetical protein